MLLSQSHYAIPEDQRTNKLDDLELFKMLLQPHFLFNSLNNLYALSVKKSDQTSDAIAGLSELLGKVVTCSRQEYIPLSEEVELIRDYIKLERIWLGENSFLLDFQVHGELERFMVPPLVIYTFVENCFKHGIRKCAGDGWSTIKLKVKGDRLFFSSRNNVPKNQDELSGTEKDHIGFGVIAATELLERKCCGRHKLIQSLDKNVYSVDLEIIQLNRKTA
ncbi:sensor histidine kinase [Bacteroidota bacterium]